MPIRPLDECYRIVALAINACSLPIPRVESPTPGTADGVIDKPFSDLGFDSLAYMEFCIAIHIETGIEINVGAVAELGSPDAVARRLSEFG